MCVVIGSYTPIFMLGSGPMMCRGARVSGRRSHDTASCICMDKGVYLSRMERGRCRREVRTATRTCGFGLFLLWISVWGFFSLFFFEILTSTKFLKTCSWLTFAKLRILVGTTYSISSLVDLKNVFRLFLRVLFRYLLMNSHCT